MLMWRLEGGGKQKKWCFGKLRASLYWRAFQKIEYFTAWNFFFTQRKKVSKMFFQLNLVIYICNRKAKKYIVFSPFLLSVCLLRSFTYRFYSICLSRAFLRCKNVLVGCFGVFGNSESFPTTVLVLSEFPKRSRRPF